MSSTRASGSRSSGEAAARRESRRISRASQPGQRERLLRELLAVEVELRISHGENPTPAQFRLRYPDWGHAITVAFEKGRSAAEAAREGMVRPPACRDDGDAVGSDAESFCRAASIHADVTVGSVCCAGCRWREAARSSRAGAARAVRGDQRAGKRRVRHGLPGARRRAFAAGGDQGAAAGAVALDASKSNRSWRRHETQRACAIRRSWRCTTSAGSTNSEFSSSSSTSRGATSPSCWDRSGCHRLRSRRC